MQDKIDDFIANQTDDQTIIWSGLLNGGII
jgi:hypothetical protein